MKLAVVSLGCSFFAFAIVVGHLLVVGSLNAVNLATLGLVLATWLIWAFIWREKQSE